MQAAAQPKDVQGPGSSRRRMIFNDAMSFLVLSAITLTVFGGTLLLFRSFNKHRADLARTWTARGRAALATRQPEQAVAAYRAALVYDPGDAEDQRMLAQALVEAGKTEEATNYFLEMWAVHPGDGFLNLELARLARRKGEMQFAVNYYRGALYGTWEGDGVVRRRAVRLELAQYLTEEKQYGAARAELLIAAGNAPESEAFDKALAELLVQAQAPGDALTLYRKALLLRPRDLTLLRAAARLAYATGDGTSAQSLLERAAQGQPSGFEQDELLLKQIDLELHPPLPKLRGSRHAARRGQHR